MSLTDLIAKVRNGLGHVGDHAVVFQLIQQERSAACQVISDLVMGQPAEVVDRFEQVLLQQSMVMIDAQSRRSAMDLYAWLKVTETIRYGQFRGFQPVA